MREDVDEDGIQGEGNRYALLQSIRSSEGARDFVDAISMNLLLQPSCDWGDLLSHAPRALCSMGQCMLAGSTSMASTISLTESNALQ